MKKMKQITMISLALLISFTLVRCDDDDPVAPSLFTVSGTISYPDFAGSNQNAVGAVVYLAKEATEATTNYDLSAVANASGVYTFENLAVGDYFMFVNYNTANTNGRVEGVNFDSGEGVLFSITDADVTQSVTLVSAGQATDFVVDTRADGDWDFDFSHSNVDFEFPYDENNAAYTGRFDQFDISIFFDPTDLASGSIEAEIDLLSVNTSSPGGRDSFFDTALDAWDFGCLRGTFGVLENAGIPDETTRYATFSATGFEEYGDGYAATGTFTFNGMSNQETLFFRFIEGYEGANFQGTEFRFSSFEGKLDFDALDDYGIESSHLGGETVSVYVSNQVTKLL